ncbi:MAG TPA: pitrilysin family protein [Vicinamibacterales bacterium]|jgi:zinc protease|nr:pitrilysin family protein [Vicinamibacterales bacterium]
MTLQAGVPVDRSRLPEPGPARLFRFPPIERSVLDSGLSVWSVTRPRSPVVTFLLLVRCGSAADPPGLEGLAATTADMLDEGSGALSAIGIHEALARIGAQFDTDIGSDAIAASVTSLGRVADRSLGLLADIVARPALADADFARVRELRQHRLTQLRGNPGAVADRLFLRTLYGAHPYGHAPGGGEASLAAMTGDDVRRFHARQIRPGASTLIAVGDCAHDRIVALARAAFAGWDGAAPDPAGPDALPPQPARLTIVPRAGAPQSELRIGEVGPPRDTPDYHALVAANMVLGGQFVSRVNLNLRERHGFTYGARTAFDFRRLPGPFSLQVSVQTDATIAAIREALGEIADVRGPRPIGPAELALGVAALTRGYARNFEAAEQIARAAMQLALFRLPDDYFEQFVPRIEQVTPEIATAAMARHVDPARLSTLVVGDADRFHDALPSLDLGPAVVLPPDSF